MYDSKCYDLARAFLEDARLNNEIAAGKLDKLIPELAQQIQDCIELFIEGEEP